MSGFKPLPKVDILHLAIPVHGSPQVVLLASDLYKYLINEKCIAVASVTTLQPTGKFGSKLDKPEADGLVAHGDAPFSQQDR